MSAANTHTRESTRRNAATKSVRQVCYEIADDMAEDAKRFDGQHFNGLTVGTYFGNQGAAIAALARMLADHDKRLSDLELLVSSGKQPMAGALMREADPHIEPTERAKMLDGMKLQILSARADGLEELLRQCLPLIENAPGGHGALVDEIRNAIVERP